MSRAGRGVDLVITRARRLRVGGLTLRELARRTYHQFLDDDVLTYAGSLAFHGVLALFPLLAFLLSLSTYFGLGELMNGLLGWAAEVFPETMLAQITTVAEDIRGSGDLTLLSLGALGSVWAASGGVRSAMTALNRAYDVPRGRATWRRYLLSLLYTVGLAVLILVGMALMLMGPRAAVWMARPFGLDDVVGALWSWARYPIAISVLMLSTAVAYSLLPNVGRFRWLSPGAVLAVALWIALSLLFRVYIANFGRYNLLYGSLGAVVVLLLYLWLSSTVLLLGGEVNAVIERARRDEAEPS